MILELNSNEAQNVAGGGLFFQGPTTLDTIGNSFKIAIITYAGTLALGTLGGIATACYDTVFNVNCNSLSCLGTNAKNSFIEGALSTGNVTMGIGDFVYKLNLAWWAATFVL